MLMRCYLHLRCTASKMVITSLRGWTSCTTVLSSRTPVRVHREIVYHKDNEKYFPAPQISDIYYISKNSGSFISQIERGSCQSKDKEDTVYHSSFFDGSISRLFFVGRRASCNFLSGRDEGHQAGRALGDTSMCSGAIQLVCPRLDQAGNRNLLSCAQKRAHTFFCIDGVLSAPARSPPPNAHKEGARFP